MPPPQFIKLDVEGAESRVLRGAVNLLYRYCPAIFLATHGTQVKQECCELLQDLDYRVVPILGDDIDQTDELFAWRNGQ